MHLDGKQAPSNQVPLLAFRWEQDATDVASGFPVCPAVGIQASLLWGFDGFPDIQYEDCESYRNLF